MAAITCILASLADLTAAHAASVLVGVNVVAVDQLNPTQQDALVAELGKEGVTVIRTTLGGKNDGYTNFVIKASQHGIRSIVMLSPNKGGSDAPHRAGEPPRRSRLGDARAFRCGSGRIPKGLHAALGIA